MKSLSRNLCFLLLAASCQTQNAPQVPEAAPVPVSTTSEDRSADTSLQGATDAVLTALQNRDFSALTQAAHPEKGLLFSPYGYVDTTIARRIPAAQLQSVFERDTMQQMLWGFFDGSGDSIRLNGPAYFRRFVYSRDFRNGDSLLVDAFRHRGNKINNLKETFPDAAVVESYTEGKMEMDWQSLQMVFEKFRNRYYLVALVHGEWTI